MLPCSATAAAASPRRPARTSILVPVYASAKLMDSCRCESFTFRPLGCDVRWRESRGPDTLEPLPWKYDK